MCRIPSTEERIVRALGGSVVLLSLGLGVFVNPWWFALTAFAGANLLQSAITGFCPPEIVYRWWTKDS
jgi:hypothetical protein